MRKLIRTSLWVVVAFVFVTPALATFHDRFIVFFPQVVKGPLHDHYETVLVLSNPGSDPVEVTLNSDLSVSPMLLPKTSRTLIASNTHPARDFSSQFVRFLPELFPNLPVGFTTGSLVVEHGYPRSLAVTALYIRGASLWSAPATAVDVPRIYIVKLKSPETFQQDVQQLALQYGYVVTDQILELRIVAIRALDEVARAVGRDPRVERVTPNIVVGLSE